MYVPEIFLHYQHKLPEFLCVSAVSARMELSGDVILASDLYTNSWIKFVKKLQVCVGLSRRDSF